MASGPFRIGAVLLVLLGATWLPLACRHDPVLPDTPAISFSEQVLPIFASNCATAGCHDGRTKFGLQNYAEISSRVKAGDAHGSEVYKAITKLSGGMPPDGPLSDEQLTLIYVWIMQGAKDN